MQSLAGQLASATLISWQSGQHGSYPDSPCVTAAVDAYLLTGDLPAVGTPVPALIAVDRRSPDRSARQRSACRPDGPQSR